jgi:hypothetical protein
VRHWVGKAIRDPAQVAVATIISFRRSHSLLHRFRLEALPRRGTVIRTLKMHKNTISFHQNLKSLVKTHLLFGTIVATAGEIELLIILSKPMVYFAAVRLHVFLRASSFTDVMTWPF